MTDPVNRATAADHGRRSNGSETRDGKIRTVQTDTRGTRTDTGRLDVQQGSSNGQNGLTDGADPSSADEATGAPPRDGGVPGDGLASGDGAILVTDAAGAPSGAASRTGNPVAEATVAAMFDEIAPVYDKMNTLMTVGLDGRWRRAAVNATGLKAGDAVIDVACGTGKLAGALAERVGPFGRVLAVDLAPGMIAEARRQQRDLVQLEFTVGDALTLPASDATFEAATIAFGLRNLPNFEAGFRELRRVVRPGGWVVCLELSVPRPRWWGRIYHAIFRRFAPFLGTIFSRKRAYEYLPSSLDGFPNPDELSRTMLRAGLVEVSFRRLGLGAVALHRGRVPKT